MKDIKKLFVVSLLIFSGVACSSDDSGGDGDTGTDDNKTLILGTWSRSSLIINSVEQPLVDACDQIFAIRFDADLDYTRFERTGINCNTSLQTSGTYSINGNALSIATGQVVQNATITNLDTNFLTFSFTQNGDNFVENYGQSR